VRTERRLGLALSGGGFHASFFHIGVLARRDEFNLLRSIELISIVSSGSIIGVLHSLLLQRSFEFTSENKITPQATSMRRKRIMITSGAISDRMIGQAHARIVARPGR
jgi:predicted acylesterase/phospholipase RssA